jgi:DNA (cytosine-5)-methyltransferase 1
MEHKAKTGKDFSPRRGKEIVPKKESVVGTLTTRKNIEQSIFDGKVLRRLTPLEFFRLQGAPDSLYHKGRELGISDTQLFKMAGNSVTVPVIKAIGERLWVDGS